MYLFILDGSTLAVALIIIICYCNRFTPMTHHRLSQGWWYQNTHITITYEASFIVKQLTQLSLLFISCFHRKPKTSPNRIAINNNVCAGNFLRLFVVTL